MTAGPRAELSVPTCLSVTGLHAVATNDTIAQVSGSASSSPVLDDDLQAFVRSLLLLSLLSFLRLLLLGLRRRPKAPFRNALLHRSRSVLQGAPLALALAVCLPLATAAPPSPHLPACGWPAADVPQSTRTPRPIIGTDSFEPPSGSGENTASAPISALRSHTAYASGAASSWPPTDLVPPTEPTLSTAPTAHTPRTVADALLPSAAVLSSHNDEVPNRHPGTFATDLSKCAESEVSSRFRFAVRLLHFQNRGRWLTGSSDTLDSLDDLVEFVEDEVDSFRDCARVYPVMPQPAARYPVLVQVPHVADHIGLIGVCVQLCRPGQQRRFWMDYFFPDFQVDDIRLALGDDWPFEAKIHVGLRHRYLRSDENIRLQHGELITVQTTASAFPRFTTLRAKLDTPPSHFDNLDSCGFPLDDTDPHWHCLLQALEPEKVFHHAPQDAGSLALALTDRSSGLLGPVKLQWPPSFVPAVVTRGHLVGSIVAAVPRSITTRVPVFLDARLVCHPVRLVFSKQGTMLLSAFLQDVGLDLPDQDSLIVDGTVMFNVPHRAVTIRPGDKVVLYYAQEFQHVLREHLRANNNVPVQPPTPTGDGTHVPAAAFPASLTPDRDRARTPRRSSSGSGTTVRVSREEEQREEGAKYKRNPGLVQEAHPTRRPGDASVEIALRHCLIPLDPILQYRLGRLASAPIVEHGIDAPQQAFAIPAPDVLPPPAEDPPQPERLLADTFPRRVCVHVYRYQRPVRRVHLWYAPTEGLSSFLERALIILGVDPEVTCLVPASPQPYSHSFALLQFPVWWEVGSIRPLLCATSHDDMPSFLHTAFTEDGLEDIIPDTMYQGNRQWDVFVTPSAPDPEDAEPCAVRPLHDLPNGALLFLCTVDAPAPTLHDPAVLLRTMEHVEAPDPHPTEHDPSALDAVLLGTDFEHHRQVGSCFGVRFLSHYGGRILGAGVFLDARAAGRPLAYRRITAQVFDPLDVCQLADLQVPEGYIPVCDGGTAHASAVDAFTLTDGDTVVLWLEKDAASPCPLSVAADVADASDDHGPSSPHDSDSSGTARSRSPRRASVQQDAQHAPTDLAPIQYQKMPTEPARVSELRLLPTPCRNAGPVLSSPPLEGIRSEPASSASIGSPHHTLLEAASCSGDFESALGAFLDRHAPLPPSSCGLDRAGPPLPDPTTAEGRLCRTGSHLRLCLQDSVPVTPFQATVLEFKDLFAERIMDPRADDWLDADLSGFLQSDLVPDVLRLRCRDIASWWLCPRPETLRSFHVFTDGSANPDPSCNVLTRAAWAFSVFADTDTGIHYYGHAASQTRNVDSPHYAGEVLDDPLTAELLALLWSLVWVADSAHRYNVPVYMAYDCVSAGAGAFGRSMPPGHSEGSHSPHSALSQAVVLMRQVACSVAEVHDAHVRGHSGVLGNEMADKLAKIEARQTSNQDVLPLWPGKLLRHDLRQWAWLVLSQPADLPTLFAFQSEAYRLQQEIRAAPPPPAPGAVLLQPEAVEIRLTMVSYNALTLLDPATGSRAPQVGLRFFGRRDLVKSQLRDMRVHLVGLQETRLRPTCISPDQHFTMLQAAADDAGCYGVALWISKELPFAHYRGQPVYVKQHDVTVLDASARHLLVCINTSRFALTVLVAHAPYDTPHACPAEPFWEAMNSLLNRAKAAGPVVVLTDSNGRVGSITTEAIGDLCADLETPAGAAFHTFLLRHSLCLPATFPDTHAGPSTTWIGPGNQHKRMDFIAIPVSWRAASSSSVWTTFESMQKREDHLPVMVHCSLQKQVTSRPYATACRRTAMRPDRCMSPESQRLLLEGLRTAPAIPWAVDVDKHFDTWVSICRHVWDTVTCHESHRPVQPYLAVTTLQLVRRRKALRAYLSQEDRALRRGYLMFGFAAFRLQVEFADGHYVASRLATHVRAVRHSIARAVHMLQQTAAELRSAVKHDRLAYLQELRSSVCLHDLRDPRRLYAAVRKAFPSAQSSRRSRFTPLPQVKLQDGTFACSNEERVLRWHEHFSELEAAVTIQPAEYADRFAGQSLAVPGGGPVFELDAVPTLASMEATMLQLKRGRACGLDGITAELLQIDAVHFARCLLPVTVKSTLSLREPTAFRGGHLMVLAKKALAAVECQDFRSILLASVAGKVQHRLLRQQLVPFLAATSSDVQAGALPGASTESLILYARTLQGYSAARAQRSAFLFFDIRAAFYRLVRQFVAPLKEAHSDFARLLQSFNLPPAAFSELEAHLANMAAIPAAGAGAHLTALVSDLFRGSWFRLDKGVALALTMRGSRPGDPMADLLYGFSLSVLHRLMDEALDDKSLLPTAPVPATGLNVMPEGASCRQGAASWADDCMRHVEADCLEALLVKAADTLQVCFERATAMGVQFAHGSSKTAILIVDPPPGQRFSRTQTPRPAHLTVTNTLCAETERVLVVPVYKYLGGILTSDACPRAEIQHRYAQAAGMIKPLRAKLFSCRTFDLSIRRVLLRTLAVSKYVYGSTALLLHVPGHAKQWARNYVALWRALLPYKDGTGKFPHAYRALHTAQAAFPPLALAHARGVLLKRLCTRGPQTVMRLLLCHWEIAPKASWLGHFLADIQLVAQFVPAADVLLGEACAIRALLDAIVGDPAWWPNTVKKAMRQCISDLAAWVEREDLRACAFQAVPVAPEPRPFACHMCDASFVLRKHLGTHLLRVHGIMSPARHFAVAPYCISCMRWFHEVKRVQAHLKLAPDCLRRAVLLVSPLTQDQIIALEAEHRSRIRAIKQGCWSKVQGVEPSTAFFGPRQPTVAERQMQMDETATLSELGAGFRPEAAHVSWITCYLSQSSHEGPREACHNFWSRDALAPSVSPAFLSFGTRSI